MNPTEIRDDQSTFKITILLIVGRLDSFVNSSIGWPRHPNACATRILNLGGRSLGKFFDEGDVVRRLEMRQVRPRKLALSIIVR